MLHYALMVELNNMLCNVSFVLKWSWMKSWPSWFSINNFSRVRLERFQAGNKNDVMKTCSKKQSLHPSFGIWTKKKRINFCSDFLNAVWFKPITFQLARIECDSESIVWLIKTSQCYVNSIIFRWSCHNCI